MWVQLSTTCSNFTEGAQWGAPSCSQPQPATDNGVRDGRSNWLVAPPTLQGQYPLSSTYCTLQCGLGCKSQDLLHWVRSERATFGIPDQRTACAATMCRFLHLSIYFSSSPPPHLLQHQANNEWHKTIRHDIAIWHSQESRMAFTNMKTTIYKITQDSSRIDHLQKQST